MCTDFCVCPGKSNEQHYIDYGTLGPIRYRQYGRTFFPDERLGSTVRPMIFSLSNNYLQKYESETLKYCIDNAKEIFEIKEKMEVQRGNFVGLPPL